MNDPPHAWKTFASFSSYQLSEVEESASAEPGAQNSPSSLNSKLKDMEDDDVESYKTSLAARVVEVIR